MKDIAAYIFLNILIASILFFGFKSYTFATHYEQSTVDMVEHMNMTDLTKNNLKNISEKISFGLYKNKTKIEYLKLEEKRTYYKEKSIEYIIYMAISSLILFLLYFFVRLKIFNIYGSVSAMIFLGFGILTPLFMVTIHKEFNLIGDVVLSFESKSLLGSIFKLYDGSNYVMAIVILLFSIVIPIIKITSLFLISFFKDKGVIHKLIGFFKMIGKWSMIDVFVVAVLLVFFTANGGDVSRGELEVGIYMFLMYVISSMILSITVSKMINNESE